MSDMGATAAAVAAIEQGDVIREHSLCSDCKLQPRIPGNSYCPECKAKYMRGYRKVAAETTQTRNVKRGMEMMRSAALRAFQQLGDAEMNGRTAADIVRRLQLEL